MAHFMQNSKKPMDYVVFERHSRPASFFQKFPRHRKLISINKRYTGRNSSTPENREYNLRHDWHSFITDDDGLLFKDFSEKYFPSADEYLQYVEAFVRRTKPLIKYRHSVTGVGRIKANSSINAGIANKHDRYLYVLHIEKGVQAQKGGSSLPENGPSDSASSDAADASGQTMMKRGKKKKMWFCKRLLIATGMAKENVPDWEGVELTESYGTYDTDPTKYSNKTVAVIGGGNAAFEVVAAIMGEAASVRQYAWKRRMAENTHYPGSLRSVNSVPLDNQMLKTQDAFFLRPFSLETIRVRKQMHRGREKLCMIGAEEEGVREAGQLGNQTARGYMLSNSQRYKYRARHCYDHIIRCTGFVFDRSVLGKLARKLSFTVHKGKAKYPHIDNNFEAVGALRNVFFLGTNAHSLDFQLSSGGLVHGFRYTIRNLFSHLQRRFHNIAWPHKNLTLLGDDFREHLIYRYGSASSMYQMFDVMCDVAVISSREGQGHVVYYYDVLAKDVLGFLRGIYGDDGPRDFEYVTLSFEYMPELDNEMVWGDGTPSDDPSKPHNNQFVHPTIRYWNTAGQPAYKSVHAWALQRLIPRAAVELYLLEDVKLRFQNPVFHLLPLDKFLERIRKAPVTVADEEYAMPWLCPECDTPRPSWRENLKKKCTNKGVHEGVCKALR
eukprot:jgi/Bigna1/130857/aug1.12_g5565